MLKRAWPADVVTVTGDLIQDDTREAYDRFKSLMTALDLPVYCIPGNHDVRPVMQAALSNAPFHYCESVRLADWLIVGIDSCVNNGAGGEIAAAPTIGEADDVHLAEWPCRFVRRDEHDAFGQVRADLQVEGPGD